MADTVKNIRRNPRYRINLKAVVICEEEKTKQTYVFQTENVSLGGVFIRGEREKYPLQGASILQVWLYLDPIDQDRIIFRGEVTHRKDENGFGIKVVEIDDQEYEKYVKALEEIIKKQPELFKII